MSGDYHHAHVLDGVDAYAARRLLRGQYELVEAVAPQRRDAHLHGLDLE